MNEQRLSSLERVCKAGAWSSAGRAVPELVEEIRRLQKRAIEPLPLPEEPLPIPVLTPNAEPHRVTEDSLVRMVCRNQRGRVEMRIIQPLLIRFDLCQGQSGWQWLLDLIDCETQEHRTVAMKDVLYWETA